MYKIIEEYNNSYHRAIGKKPILADYSVLTDKFETNLKALKFKVADRIRITKCKKTFSKEYLWLTLCLELIVGLIKLKIYTEKKQ